MSRFLRYAAYFLGLAVLPSIATAASEPPPRKAGLWVVTSKDNPFANWSACVGNSNDNVIDSDIWDNFAKECQVAHTEKTADGQTVFAYCESGLTGKVKLLVEFSGDFQKDYHLESTTVFTGKTGQEEGQTFTIDGHYAGACPADLPVGKKKMAR